MVKEGINTTRINDIYKNRFRSDTTFDINIDLQQGSPDLKQVVTGVYKMADWLSSSIHTLAIP